MSTYAAVVPITAEDAAKVAEIPHLHKDPFDQLLVAQTAIEPMILLTNGGALRAYGSHILVV